jgi:16S rRNA G1207 methylase RsmC
MTDQSSPIVVAIDDGGRLESMRKGSVVVDSRHGLRRAERFLIDNLPSGRSGGMLLLGDKNGVVAEVAARLNPSARVVAHYFDHFFAEQARARSASSSGQKPIEISLASDLPIAEPAFDFVGMAHSKNEDSALACELVQDVLDRLAPNGKIVVGIDFAGDHLLRTRVKRVFGDVTIETAENGDGVTLIARRGKKSSKPKPPRIETFTVADRGVVSTFRSRPGVFAAGKIDDGARALLAEVEVEDGASIADIGCGLGTVGVTLARRIAAKRLFLVDSNVRAIDLARANAEEILSGRGVDIVTRLTSEPEKAVFDRDADVVVANPPYFSNFRIAGVFLDAARRAVKPRGRVHFVSKSTDWYRTELPRFFRRVEEKSRGGYAVFSASDVVDAGR